MTMNISTLAMNDTDPAFNEGLSVLFYAGALYFAVLMLILVLVSVDRVVNTFTESPRHVRFKDRIEELSLISAK